MGGIGSAIDKSVRPLQKRGDRNFLELTGDSKHGFSIASRVPDTVEAADTRSAAAAAKQEQIHTKHKQEISRHLQTIMQEKAKQHSIHVEHQSKAMDLAKGMAKDDAKFVEAVAQYAHELGIIRNEAQAAVNAYDSRIQLELGAIGF